MATLPVIQPMFKTTGSQKEPVRLSYPVGTGATFLERDFLTISGATAAPQTNGTQLPAPPAPDATGSTAAGSIGAGTYFVAYSYLNGNGETTVGPTTTVVLGGSGEIIAVSPPVQGDATGWRLYAGTVLGTLHLQGATTAIGTGITQTTYSAGGAAPQTTNGTGLAAPTAPTLSAGGTTGPAARTEYYTITYVTDVGETVASGETSQALTNGQLVTVTAPGASGDAIGYNVYAATISGQEVKQNSTPIGVATNWVEPATGLVLSGVQRATTNQVPTVNGVGVILGMADHDYNATYGGPVGGVQPGLSDAFGRPQFNQSVFGITEVYSGISTEPKNAHIISTAVNFEICLLQAWDPGMVGQQVGLLIDSTTNYFVADATQPNKVASIVGPVDGPGRGVPGDVYKRIAIKFLGTASVPG